MGRGSRNLGATLAFELLPAAIFNFAVAFAVASSLRRAGFESIAAEASVASGIAAFLLVWVLLRRLGGGERRFDLPSFEQVPVEPFEPEAGADAATAESDIILTETDELLLDDIVESIGAESRVVQLFRADGTPTAGELQARIDEHLRSAPRQAAGDAAQELRDALSALKQSLR